MLAIPIYVYRYFVFQNIYHMLIDTASSIRYSMQRFWASEINFKFHDFSCPSKKLVPSY